MDQKIPRTRRTVMMVQEIVMEKSVQHKHPDNDQEGHQAHDNRISGAEKRGDPDDHLTEC